ncbi:hypothetical protein B0H17DRAFT_1067619 [Mycena rosella]|uniref:Uncharacterized protein n=1 Tax=Mycena rosella TaxID=1033263 RepID=A0AAD7B6M5_MYCRO|nr:hypothetical protein B0H17DRAFT_1117497 [Mycena rosella]KAJ7672096.1 hypothetical protein B0H17DRAFT_1084407 [Mycena rosella]KAJ7686366.1 hypothetical protein B0H17DRAFT_1072087 [Mycena rosella]KAJ7689059.1 hypothetical protein B0H17DRAFT_1067619 [Mycena rosella]
MPRPRSSSRLRGKSNGAGVSENGEVGAGPGDDGSGAFSHGSRWRGERDGVQAIRVQGRYTAKPRNVS